MRSKRIDLEQYARKAHFEHFLHQPNPHVGLTAEVDVTDLRECCGQNRWSFYLAFLHLAVLAANRVPELRQRIFDGGIVEYDACGSSHVELLEDGTYGYCTLYHDPKQPMADYLAEAEKIRRVFRARATIEEDADVLGLDFITTVPWIRYTALIQPTSGPEDSNPRISWGKFAPDYCGRLMMPLSILCHHSLVDGLQIAAFYRNVEELLAQFA